MRITGWAIDGFGRFHAATVDDLPAGLVVVHGPNEAGKTTLTDFLKGMLFGFPPRGRRGHRAPLDGGTFGGRLFVTHTDGSPYTISRGQRGRSLRVHGPEGELDPSVLDQLLGGASAGLFDKVFAVDLDALQGPAALDDEAVRDRIFSAGVLGAGRSATAALDALARRRDELWRPTGRKAASELKRLAAELTDRRARLEEAQHTALGTADLQNRIGDLDHQISLLREEADGLRARQRLLEAVEGLWPAWREARDARQRLADSPPSPDLPAGHLDRLTEAIRRVDDGERAVEEARRRVERAEATRAEVRPDVRLLAHRDEIQDLLRQRAVVDERRERATLLRSSIEQHRHDLRVELARLGPGCDEQWLARRADTLEAESQLRAAAREVERRRSILERGEHDIRRRRQEEAREAAALDEERSELESAGTLDPAEARRRSERLGVLEALLNELARARRSLSTAGSHATHTRPPRSILLVPLAMAVVAGALGAAALAAGSPVAGAAALSLAAALAAIAVGAGRGVRTPADARRAAPPATAEVDRLAADVEAVAAELGASAPLDPGDLTRLRDRVGEDLQRAEALQRVNDAQHRLRAATARRRARDDTDLAAARRAHLEAEQAWEQWLATLDVPTTLDAAGVADHVAALRRAHLAHDQAERERVELERLRRHVAAHREQLHAVARLVGLDVRADADDPSLLDRLHERFEEAVAADRQAALRDQALHEAREAHERTVRELEAAGARLVAVLEEARVTSVDAALALHDRAQQQRAWATVVERAERDLDLTCGPAGPRRDAAVALLGCASPLDWQEELRSTSGRLAAIEDDERLLTGQRAIAADELERTLGSADVPTVQLDVETLTTELAEAVAEWTTLTAAHRMIELTLARYKQERQPRVVRRAAELFATVTDGTYHRLVVDESAICAVDRLGRHVDAGSLSRGAVEQLYLCLRFALAEELATTSPLPILLDDVLVNADPRRSRQLARAVVEVARRHQVFLFTCHPWVLDLVQEAGGCHVVELPGAAAA